MESYMFSSGQFWPTVPLLTSLYLGFTAPTALVLVTARKSSFTRFIWATSLLYIAYCFCICVHGLKASQFVKGVIAGPATVATLQCLNLLLVTNLDGADLIRGKIYTSSSSLSSRVLQTWRLLIAFRAVGTIWQVKNVPEHPAYYRANDGKAQRLTRPRYLLREGSLIIWQYLFLNLLDITTKNASDDAHLFAPGAEFKYFSASREELQTRFLIGVFSWIVPSRVCLNIMSRVYFWILVLLGISSPETCRPGFGRLHDAYTVRGFWGKFWHQTFRWPLTSFGNYIARDVLGLARPSLLERYTNIFFTFFTSGVLHLICDSVLGIPPSKSGAMMFFCAAPLGIMLEDGVQELWRRVTDGSKKDDAVSTLWQRLIGFIWVCFWMSATSPWYIFPSARTESNAKWMAPISVLDGVDIKAAQKFLAAYGLFLFWAVGGEI